jgi:hypothetical protein
MTRKASPNLVAQQKTPPTPTTNKRRPNGTPGDTEGDTYVPEPAEQLLSPDDDLGEELAEEYLISATSGEQAAEDIRNEETPEERGGPFVETTAAQEIDYEDDEPEDSEAEPFPTATSTEEEESD